MTKTLKCEYPDEECGRDVVAKVRLYDPDKGEYRWFTVCRKHGMRYLAHMGGYD